MIRLQGREPPNPGGGWFLIIDKGGRVPNARPLDPDPVRTGPGRSGVRGDKATRPACGFSVTKTGALPITSGESSQLPLRSPALPLERRLY